jgi:hypothetical protein
LVACATWIRTDPLAFGIEIDCKMHHDDRGEGTVSAMACSSDPVRTE